MPRGKHGNHCRGTAHHAWNHGMATHQDGYLKVRVGVEHPLADPNGYAYLHLLVWAAAGRPLPGPDELLDHHDENKQNNRIANLRLMTRSAHAKRHSDLRGRDAHGRFPKRGGRDLDGRTWDEYPRERAVV